jgi:hypothetical protein
MDGKVGETSFEPVLYEYGILTEQSDIRAHVSVANRLIYVFPTLAGVEAVKKKDDNDLVSAGQQGVTGKTADGWLVSPGEIEGLKRVKVDGSWPDISVKSSLSTGQKGRFAIRVVCRALTQGLFPLWISAEENATEDIQISGTDIVLACEKRIQVKCDWNAGDRPLGTGNLFLQRAERNPKKQY